MSAEMETTFTRVKSSAEEQAKAAVEIQVCGLIFSGNPAFFYIIIIMESANCIACELFRCRW